MASLRAVSYDIILYDMSSYCIKGIIYEHCVDALPRIQAERRSRLDRCKPAWGHSPTGVHVWWLPQGLMFPGLACVIQPARSLARRSALHPRKILHRCKCKPSCEGPGRLSYTRKTWGHKAMREPPHVPLLGCVPRQACSGLVCLDALLEAGAEHQRSVHR